MPSLSQLSWPQVEDLADAVLVVPVGATEQHGPHLPFSTDTDIAVALAERLAAAWPRSVVVATAIALGSSGEHQAFPGTLSIGGPALETVLVELGRSAACTWQRQLFLSTHGGNRDVVRRAVQRLRDESREVDVWMPSWSGDAHAGRTETSLMLAIAPERVQLAAAAPGATEPLASLLPAMRSGGVAAVSSNGVLGDPTGASAVEGEALLSAALAELIEHVRVAEMADA